jgi:hypothetical protein
MSRDASQAAQLGFEFLFRNITKLPSRHAVAYLVLPENNGRQSARRDALSPKEASKVNQFIY